MARTLQGKFRPLNPNKYNGDAGNIIYRSSWEKIFCNWCDKNDDIIAWQSEERRIRYYDPVAKKNRIYFPDFYIKYKRSDGIIVEELIEVKPQRQIDGPSTNPKRRPQSGLIEVRTYVTNQAKWKAAANYADGRGWNFRLISEKHLGLK